MSLSQTMRTRAFCNVHRVSKVIGMRSERGKVDEAERVGIAMRLGGQVTPRRRRGRHGLRGSESLARRQRPHRTLGRRMCDVNIARHGLGHGKRIHLAAVVVAKGVGEHGIRVVLGRAALEGEGRRLVVGGAGGHWRRHAT